MSFLLFLIAFFTFIVMAAGSHDGHFGLFYSSDSFYFFLAIYFCFVGILEINHLNHCQKVRKSNVQRRFNRTLYRVLIGVGLFILIVTVMEDNTANESQRISGKNYLMIIIPLVILLFGFYKIEKEYN